MWQLFFFNECSCYYDFLLGVKWQPIQKFGIRNGDYKLIKKFHTFDVNLIKLLKFKKILPWFPTNKTKKKKNTHTQQH